MNIKNLSMYRCPMTGSVLELSAGAVIENGVITHGKLSSDQSLRTYSIKNGFVDFITPEQDIRGAEFARKYYAQIAKSYDNNVHITFDLYNESEAQVRKSMIDLLRLEPHNKVLEVSAGTGRDSSLIASRLSENGGLWLLDISPDMLAYNREKVENACVPTEHVVASACNLPFESKIFDALYCFAGVGHFPDIAKGLKEMARVVKVGGRVVFCEKNVPEWLRSTEYGKICINNNPMFADAVPFKHIPVEARDVGVRWINGNVHYVFDYTVGEGEPKGNFDLELPGERGGTFNTRYYGKLEGVSRQTKELALAARKKVGISMHRWLDNVIRRESIRVLNDNE